MAQPSPNRSNSSNPSTLTKSNDVFISYSRKDKAFVETLDAALRQAKRDPWIDWDDIRKGEDWWQSIRRGIEAAETFLFVVSPDSVASSVCWDEIEYASQCHKRFLPLVWREGFDMQQLHPSISRHNWLFFRETDDFATAFKELLKALDTDLDYLRTHTRLLMRSLEWRNKAQDSSYLLRGTDLADAQEWLNQNISKEPRPTDSQVAYINASLEAKAATLRARHKAKWIVVLTTVIANLGFVAGGLYWIYTSILDSALVQVGQAMESTLMGAIAGIDGDQFAALANVDLPPGQDEPIDNQLYQDHQAWLQTVQQIEASAEPVTYTRGTNTNQVLIIGDTFRITNPEEAYAFRESKIPNPDNLEMLHGLEEVTLDLDEDTDDMGTWVAIYGPIRNAAGESVGALALEYDATYVTDVKDYVGAAIGKVCVLAFIWLVISSWLILRATQPPGQS